MIPKLGLSAEKRKRPPISGRPLPNYQSPKQGRAKLLRLRFTSFSFLRRLLRGCRRFHWIRWRWFIDRIRRRRFHRGFLSRSSNGRLCHRLRSTELLPEMLGHFEFRLQITLQLGNAIDRRFQIFSAGPLNLMATAALLTPILRRRGVPEVTKLMRPMHRLVITVQVMLGKHFFRFRAVRADVQNDDCLAGGDHRPHQMDSIHILKTERGAARSPHRAPRLFTKLQVKRSSGSGPQSPCRRPRHTSRSDAHRSSVPS